MKNLIFISIIILCMIMMSCQSQSGRRSTEVKANTESIYLTDAAMIDTLNSLDSTATLQSSYLDNDECSIVVFCFVIKSNRTLHLYKGKGKLMKDLFINTSKGYKMKEYIE